MTINASTKPCDECNKSSLSLLLLRPSPIPKGPELRLTGGDYIKTDPELVEGLVPKRMPTESRYGLRLLRAGYVYVYIKKPPAGVKQWLVHRVTSQGDLVPDTNALFASDQDVACTREGHNPTGMKLLSIPKAHEIRSIWIAYSANLWNDKLKGRNAANPDVMQQVSLRVRQKNTFTPTVEELKRNVIECALASYKIDGSTEHDFPFTSVAANRQHLAEDMQRAAASHPVTKGHELAVVLRDPVGVAIELNALRLRRHDVGQRYLLTPKVRQPLEVNRVIETLKAGLMSEIDTRALDAVSPCAGEPRFRRAKSRRAPTGKN